MNKLVVTKDSVYEESLTKEEELEIEEIYTNNQKLKLLQPSKEEIEDAKIKLKSLEIMEELGVINNAY